jgi:hypothetical protein
MPLDTYRETAKVLDYRRLGKQRVECKQILLALTGQSKGWVQHPAVKMWRGYEDQLALYAAEICMEWRRRGYRDTLLSWFTEQHTNLPSSELPPWMGNPDFHLSHRSNLLRKAPDHYGQLWPEVPNDLPYVWPMP